MVTRADGHGEKVRHPVDLSGPCHARLGVPTGLRGLINWTGRRSRWGGDYRQASSV
ncbi:hypothetical protein [Roseovarius sp. D22-M7]|uniref:hypothetical protein n=1 Tax=Roseovarius sp. D22-M7 TaxID=3127116 RepID=UPI003010231C